MLNNKNIQLLVYANINQVTNLILFRHLNGKVATSPSYLPYINR